jgi:hypothetical protein
MTSKQRLLKAIEGGIPDRLPVTTHHLQSYFLKKHMNNISIDGFFEMMGMDPILWLANQKPDTTKGEYPDPLQGRLNFLEAQRVSSDNWRFKSEAVPNQNYETVRHHIITPKGALSTVLQSNTYTTWVAEPLIKEKRDIALIDAFMTYPVCDVDAVNDAAETYGETGIVRGAIPGFELYGQPGCWQDACCLFGTENMIMEAYDDPEWVHEFLGILLKRKLVFTKSLLGAKYDILELGGGDASTTIISPGMFREFVAPYDARIITTAHEAGQRIVYHTCGGMMPILEDIADMNPDAMETFTPPDMGGDTNLAEAKKRIGHRVCMIGGFDQGHYFIGCDEKDTRKKVREAFEHAGEGGGFILTPSDHFFDADPILIKAFADEARQCTYEGLGH